MILVTRFYIIQNLHRLVKRGRFHQHLLKTTFQSTVLLYILAILVQRRRPDTLNFSTSQRRFQHIGRIQITPGTSGPDNRVNLINKQNNIPVLRQLGKNRFHTFLELAPVLRTCHDRSYIQRNHSLVKQNP